MKDEDKEHLLGVLKGREARARRVFNVAYENLCKTPGDEDSQRAYYQSRGALNEIRDIVRYVEDWV